MKKLFFVLAFLLVGAMAYGQGEPAKAKKAKRAVTAQPVDCLDCEIEKMGPEERGADVNTNKLTQTGLSNSATVLQIGLGNKSTVDQVSKMSENGRDQIIHLIKKGDLLGERSLINDEASNLKAVAVNDMEVCFIPKEEIVRDLEKNPNFTMDILKNMATSLKEADNVIVDMAQKTVKQRLAATLLYLNDKFPKRENGSIDIHLTREDIANIIGTATESAIRLLAEFKKKALIQLKGKEIFVLDTTSLKHIAQGL